MLFSTHMINHLLWWAQTPTCITHVSSDFIFWGVTMHMWSCRWLPLFRDTQCLHSLIFTTYTQAAGVPESWVLKQETVKTTAQIFNTVKPSNLKPSFFKFPKSNSFTASYLIYLVRLRRTLLHTSVLKDNITTHQAILRSRSCAASQTESMATLSIRHATAVTTTVRANCNIVWVTNKPHKFRH